MEEDTTNKNNKIYDRNIFGDVLKRLELLGPSQLLRLKIDELHALLVNNDPLGSIPKPNKKTWLEKANLLPTFQAALGR